MTLAFSLDNATFTYAGGGDAIALKLTAGGEGIWARSFGQDQQQAFQRAAFDGERFYLVGDTRGPIQGPDGNLLPHLGLSDIMVKDDPLPTAPDDGPVYVEDEDVIQDWG